MFFRLCMLDSIQPKAIKSLFYFYFPDCSNKINARNISFIFQQHYKAGKTNVTGHQIKCYIVWFLQHKYFPKYFLINVPPFFSAPWKMPRQRKRKLARWEIKLMKNAIRNKDDYGYLRTTRTRSYVTRWYDDELSPPVYCSAFFRYSPFQVKAQFWKEKSIGWTFYDELRFHSTNVEPHFLPCRPRIFIEYRFVLSLLLIFSCLPRSPSCPKLRGTFGVSGYIAGSFFVVVVFFYWGRLRTCFVLFVCLE